MKDKWIYAYKIDTGQESVTGPKSAEHLEEK